MSEKFDGAAYQALLTRLRELSDEKYLKFNLGLIPGATCSYGVRLPQLREIARELAKGDWRGYLCVARDDTHTERMLQGLVIAYAKCDFDEKLIYIEAFIPKIDNWAICDTFSSTLKEVKKHREQAWDFITRHIGSTAEFELRLCVVMLMDYFIDEAYIDRLLNMLCGIRHEGYYVKMAVAWAISFCYIKFRDKTLALLLDNDLNDFTFNKSIQKMCESYRVTDEDKLMLKKLKRK